jgi:hypothetical protein
VNPGNGATGPVQTGVDNGASVVDRRARIWPPGQADTFSPLVSHMSDGPVTLREWGVRPRFHSAYYRSISFLIDRSRGW